jgi:polysaccharide chain length determinant protein (PEP-CTERM system associated)
MQAEETTGRELGMADYIAMLRRHWVIILIFTIAGPPIGYIAAKLIPPRYVSQTTVLVQPPAVSDKIVPDLDTTSMNQKLASMKQQILSRTSLEPVIRQYGLYQNDLRLKTMDELVDRLQAAVEVTPIAPIADTGSNDLPGFSVTVTLDDPHKAQDVCAQLTSMFIQASNEEGVQTTTQVTQFLTQQVAEAKDALDQQDAKMAAFKAGHIGLLAADEQSNLNVLTTLNSQYDAASQALESAQRDKSFEESELQQAMTVSHETVDGQSPTTLEQQLETEKSQLANLQSAGYKDTYPDVEKAKANIATLEKQIADGLNSSNTAKTQKPVTESAQVATLRAQINSYNDLIAQKTRAQEQIQTQIDQYRARIQQSPAVEAEYTELNRGYTTAQENYDALLKQQHDAQMSVDLNRQQQGEFFHVLDPANLPTTAAFPKKLYFVAGGFAGGLGLGLALTILLEMKDTSLKSEKDVEFTLRLPVLALIPAVAPVTTKKAPPMLGPATADSGLTLGA